MDSLKGCKGSPKFSNIPVAIRFNAGEESLEDVKPTVDQLSTSPSHHNSEDTNWRKEFLHSGFFSRKRSGSIEGATNILNTTTSELTASVSPAVAGAVTTIAGATTTTTATPNHGHTVGSWKIIKGKLSQAMEDIKSVKHDSQHSRSSDHDSDADSITVNSSISDDFNDQTQPINRPPGPKMINSDSDSDVDSDLLIMCQETDPSILKKSFENLRSRSSNIRSTKDSLISKLNRTKDGWTTIGSSGGSGGSGGSSSGKHQFQHHLLKRKKKNDPNQSNETKRDHIEIESGVEITEGMTLGMYNDDNRTNERMPIELMNASNTINQLATKLPNICVATTNTITSTSNTMNAIKYLPFFQSTTTTTTTTSDAMTGSSANRAKTSTPPSLSTTATTKNSFLSILFNRKCSTVIAIVAFIIYWFISVPPFFQGILTCLAIIGGFSSVQQTLMSFINTKITEQINGSKLDYGPEHCQFSIPDYRTMPICEIPPIEEHTQWKCYSGWMNEIVNYNPGNYHSSMSRSVFIKLDGSSLRISNTNARIPKRSMWNEQLIDHKSITFTRHRFFDLLGCRIEMCPRGLARKRYFSRKYPIQLIIKNTPEKGEAIAEKLDKTNQFNETIYNDGINHMNQSMNDGTATTTTTDDIDFAVTILTSDLQKLRDHQDILNNSSSNKDPTLIPCGDDQRILLFARSDREKEDWYRRFMAASIGTIHEHEFQYITSDMIMINERDLSIGMKQRSTTNIDSNSSNSSKEQYFDVNDKLGCDDNDVITPTAVTTSSPTSTDEQQQQQQQQKTGRSTSLFDGLLMTSCAARCPSDYIRFMSIYQNACSQKTIPVIHATPAEASSKKNRREKKHEDDLWKGIDQSLYLGPSGSVVWANVLVGRILFSCLNDAPLLARIQDFLQKKLSAIKLPSFMEEVIIAQVNLGDTPPLVHRISQPLLDERGTWIDADVTYEGLMHMTITTKLNLLRLKRQQQHTTTTPTTTTTTTNVTSSSTTTSTTTTGGGGTIAGVGMTTSIATTFTSTTSTTATPIINNVSRGDSVATILNATGGGGVTYTGDKSGEAIYDSNAESSGASSSESESPSYSNADNLSDQQSFYAAQGSSKKFLRIVDRITASNLFQSAAEIPYIQKAMENMSTKIRLRVDLKGLVARCTINIPPPPSDRIWIGFRGPPRLWISATPAVGDHTFDWSIVTNAIESKLCDEVTKYLVYPNMVDIIVPFLGQSTYKE